MKLFFSVVIMANFLFSCTSLTNDPTPSHVPDSNAVYIPIKDLIREDINKVDSFAAGIQQIIRIDTTSNYAYISFEAFKNSSNDFYASIPSRQQLQEEFKETPLYDESSGELSLIYTPFNPTHSIQRMVAYVQSGEVRDVMKRLYVEEFFQEKDSMVTRKTTWKIGQYCSIAAAKSKHGQQGPLIIQKTIWDPTVFEENEHP